MDALTGVEKPCMYNVVHCSIFARTKEYKYSPCPVEDLWYILTVRFRQPLKGMKQLKYTGVEQSLKYFK